MTHIETFLRRMEKANTPKNGYPYDRVINSIDFLRALAVEVDTLVAESIALSDTHNAELKRRNNDATGVFKRDGSQTS